MFCSQCGHDLAEHARFCPTCGRQQQATETSRELPAEDACDSGEPLLRLKPVFEPRLHLLMLAPIGLFFAIWGGGFLGGISLFVLEFAGIDVPMWMPFAVCALLSAVTLPIVSFAVTRRTLEKTSYTFYRDRLDYHEGFFTVEEKTIPLDRITEVNLRKGPFQAKYGLGTIVLATSATPTTTGRAGLRLFNLRDPDERYRQIKEILNPSRHGRARAAA